MGGHVSSIKGKLRDSNRRGSRAPKLKIGILAFEVANVMSKAMQLWQSLSELEILRLRTEVIKAEGVLNLVSDNEALLLSLACEEKLQDLTAVAAAVARLGGRCQDAVLRGFEHIFNDMMTQTIDVRSWEFSGKEMDSKMKKMERCVISTTSLYQELEAMANLEQTLKRMLDDEANTPKDVLAGMQQKSGWQRQEVKYLRDLSLWNRTYDKVVRLLARTVCTIHGRIVTVFGSPMLGLPQFPPRPVSNGDLRHGLFPQPSYLSSDGTHLSGRDVHLSDSRSTSPTPNSSRSYGMAIELSSSPPPFCSMQERDSGSLAARVSTEVRPTFYQNELSSGPQITQHRNSISSSPSYQNSLLSHSLVSSANSRVHGEISRVSGFYQGISSPTTAHSHSLHPGAQYGGRHSSAGQNVRNHGMMMFHPKHRIRNAPSSTLGGCALALHYANVIIIIEKMVRFPHLIVQDARDDLYQMLPNSVRTALRSRLRAIMRCYDSTRYDTGIATDWKSALETILAWLAPLAHNMIRWQSEHNFEQQQMVARTNVLLLQTLYFADQTKAEAAITELLVGLNYVYGHEQETRAAAAVLEYSNHEEYDEYLDWRF